jgi:hypothetical protein
MAVSFLWLDMAGNITDFCPKNRGGRPEAEAVFGIFCRPMAGIPSASRFYA